MSNVANSWQILSQIAQKSSLRGHFESYEWPDLFSQQLTPVINFVLFRYSVGQQTKSHCENLVRFANQTVMLLFTLMTDLFVCNTSQPSLTSGLLFLRLPNNTLQFIFHFLMKRKKALPSPSPISVDWPVLQTKHFSKIHKKYTVSN